MDQRLERLLDLLDTVDGESVSTSVRLPRALREAAAVAAEAGLISSASDVTVRGLRAELQLVARRAVLDAHYEQFPETRPDLAEIALMAAELYSHPLANSPDLIRRAAAEIAFHTEQPSVQEVLAFASGLAAAA